MFVSKECCPDFWDKYKAFFEETTREPDWQKLTELDTKRMNKRREILGNYL